VRVVVLIAIFSLGLLHETLEPHAYLWLLAAVGVVCATLSSTSRMSQEDLEEFA
jgi:hypothetical protein